MVLVEQDLFGDRNKVEIALERLRTFEPPEGYFLAFSGGKDSTVLKDLAVRSGVKFRAVYQVTSIDPPDLVRYIRKHHPDVEFSRSKIPILQNMVTNGYPTRGRRWCCRYIKECAGKGEFVLTGIRWGESQKRSKRRMTERCQTDRLKKYLHPIIDWSDCEVWEYLRTFEVPYCSLYDEGFKRLGCLFCPMTNPENRRREADRYPRYAEVFKIFLRRLYHSKLVHLPEGGKTFDGADEFAEWWLFEQGSGPRKKHHDGQISIFDC